MRLMGFLLINILIFFSNNYNKQIYNECFIAWEKIDPSSPIIKKIIHTINGIGNLRSVHIERNETWILFGYDGEIQKGSTFTFFLFDSLGNRIGEIQGVLRTRKQEVFTGKSQDRIVFDCWKKYYLERYHRTIEQVYLEQYEKIIEQESSDLAALLTQLNQDLSSLIKLLA